MSTKGKLIALCIALYLPSLACVLADERWHIAGRGVFYQAAFTVCGFILLGLSAIFGLILLGMGIEKVQDTVRTIVRNWPRLMYVARVADLAWVAWDEPAIAERRKAFEARALAEQRALDRAIIEAAHQKAVRE